MGAGAYAGKGNREAFYLAMENAADPSKHSVIAGSGPRGATLRVRKVFATETSPVRTMSNGVLTLDEVENDPVNQGPKRRFADVLDTFMRIPASGTFEMHVNPSTRPIVAEQRIRGVAETPYRTQTWQNTQATLPSEHIDKEFSIAGSETVRLLKVSLDWATPDDYDLEIYLKQADGTLKDMGGSGGPPGAKEVAYIEDAPPGNYVLRVVNFVGHEPVVDDEGRGVRARAGHRDRRRQGSVEVHVPRLRPAQDAEGLRRPRWSRGRRQPLPLDHLGP